MTCEYKGLEGITGSYNGLQGVTRGYNGLEGVTRSYNGLQGVTRGYRGLQGVTGGYKGLQRGQRILEPFFKLERFQILFLGVFCIKIKVQEMSNFRPKPWTNLFGEMPILCVFETDLLVIHKGLFAI